MIDIESLALDKRNINTTTFFSNDNLILKKNHCIEKYKRNICIDKELENNLIFLLYNVIFYCISDGKIKILTYDFNLFNKILKTNVLLSQLIYIPKRLAIEKRLAEDKYNHTQDYKSVCFIDTPKQLNKINVDLNLFIANEALILLEHIFNYNTKNRFTLESFINNSKHFEIIPDETSLEYEKDLHLSCFMVDVTKIVDFDKEHIYQNTKCQWESLDKLKTISLLEDIVKEENLKIIFDKWSKMILQISI